MSYLRVQISEHTNTLVYSWWSTLHSWNSPCFPVFSFFVPLASSVKMTLGFSVKLFNSRLLRCHSVGVKLLKYDKNANKGIPKLFTTYIICSCESDVTMPLTFVMFSNTTIWFIYFIQSFTNYFGSTHGKTVNSSFISSPTCLSTSTHHCLAVIGDLASFALALSGSGGVCYWCRRCQRPGSVWWSLHDQTS